MKKIMILSCGIYLLFVNISFGASSQTVTVGPSGDYASIAVALAQADIGDGTQESERDTVIVQNGTYPSTSAMATYIDVDNENYITIEAEATGNVTITPSANLFRWKNSEHVKIKGIDVTGGAGFGIFLFNNNITLDTCNAYNNSSGGVAFGGDAEKTSGAGGHSHVLVNCKFNNNGSLPDGGHHGILIQNTSATSWTQKTLIDSCELNRNGEDGIQTAGAVDNTHADETHIAAFVEIKNCKINDNGENGIDLKASRYIRIHHNEINGNVQAAIVIHSPENSGLPGNTGCFKNAIYNNWIANNLSRAIQTGDGDYTQGSYNLIFNNVMLNNVNGGLWAASGKRVVGDVIFNNTILGTSGSDISSWAGGWGVPYEEGILENSVINNIILNNNNPGFKSIRTFTKINNLLDNDEQDWTDNFYTTDIKFIDEANQNYRLASSSPARLYVYTGQIFTIAQVNEYKTLLGSDLPINEYGATIDYDDLQRINFPGAFGGVAMPVINSIKLQ